MLSVSLFGETKNIYDNLVQLRKMALFECDVKVRRIDSEGNKTWKVIKSSELVPGDIFEVPEGKKLPCDALMLYGQCVLNESMLTGMFYYELSFLLQHFCDRRTSLIYNLGESTPSVKLSVPRSEEV